MKDNNIMLSEGCSCMDDISRLVAYNLGSRLYALSHYTILKSYNAPYR